MKSFILTACLTAGLLLYAVPALADGPVSVKFDLYDGDKYSHALSDGIRNAMSGDERFTVVDKLPPDGIKVIMNDAVTAGEGSEIASYSVDIKLGSGKFVATKSGYCDIKKFDMCGRVVTEDVYDAYTEYMVAHH